MNAIVDAPTTDRAALVAERDRLQRESNALRRQLDAEEPSTIPTYEETQERADQEKRLQFLRRTLFNLSTRIEGDDRAARQAAIEKGQIRDNLAFQLKAAQMRLARVESEIENILPVIANHNRRRERVLGEIADLEARLRAFEPATPPVRKAPTDPAPTTETLPPSRPAAPSLARRVRSALAWSADPNDDSGE